MSDSTRSRIGSRRRRADGTIEVTVCHGYRVDGKRRRLTGIAADEAEADRIALELAARLGMRPDLGRGLTLRRWWDAYSATKGARLAKSTLTRYRGDMERVWLPALGDADVSLITADDIQRVLISLPSRPTAQHARTTLSAVLTQAVRDGHLAESPMRRATFELPDDTGASLDFEVGDDPFAAIEGSADVWDARTVMVAYHRMMGIPLETCWLAMVGAGLRREEALALTWKDVRRVEVAGREVTQLAVYKALTAQDGLKRTKTARSVRIVAMLEPFGERLWELRDEPHLPVCPVSAGNIHHRWRCYFDPVTSKHAKKKGLFKGRLVGLPYVPLNRMRATHETFMQQAGVSDSVNAAVHGRSHRVSYEHYQRPDGIGAARAAGDFLLVEGGRKAANA